MQINSFSNKRTYYTVGSRFKMLLQAVKDTKHGQSSYSKESLKAPSWLTLAEWLSLTMQFLNSLFANTFYLLIQNIK